MNDDTSQTETQIAREFQDERESGRHPVNVGHLVMGIAFVGLVSVWAIFTSDVVEGRDMRWLLPVPWVLAGSAGLVAATWSARRADRPNRPDR